MKNAILLHGLTDKKEYYNPDRPSASNSHWFPWLQKELLMNEIKADTPEVLRVYELQYQSWVEEVERFPIGQDSTLVGHSAGGGFWVRYLSEHPEISIDKLILVAPWMDPNREYNTGFYDFEIDTNLANRVNELLIFSSDNDGQEMKDTIDLLKKKLPSVIVRDFHEYGHFTQRTLKDNKFPELLQAILS
jgi:predicted alpha/beta hydrolase family esterase